MGVQMLVSDYLDQVSGIEGWPQRLGTMKSIVVAFALIVLGVATVLTVQP